MGAAMTDECEHEGMEYEGNCHCPCDDCWDVDDFDEESDDPYDPTTNDGSVAHDGLDKPSYES
jgi:hypothetical protein